MDGSSNQTIVRATGVFLIAFLWLSLNIGGNSIYILDEAKNAACAMEMMARNDWIVPTFNGELRTDKPVLHYYFMIVAYKLFGINPFAARFFSSVFGALTIMITFSFTSIHLNRKVANWVVIVFLSSLHFALQFHLAVPDPYLVFFITASLFTFYHFFIRHYSWSLFLFYFCVGLGTLVKGPIAIAIPGAAIVVFLVITKKFSWQEIRKFRPFLGALLVALIALPWYILVHNKTDGLWTEGFFLQHNLGRFSNTMEGHGGIFLLTPLFVFIGLLPFSLLILPAMKLSWNDRKQQALGLCLSVLGVVIVVFSISSTKLPNYTVPTYPFMAIILAYYLHHVVSKKVKFQRWSIVFYTILTLILPILAYLVLKEDKSLNAIKWMSMYFLILPVGALVAWWYSYRKLYKEVFYAWFLSFLIFSIVFFTGIFPTIDQTNPVAQASQLMLDENMKVAYYKRYNPAFSFQLQKEIVPLPTLDAIKSFKRRENSFYLISRKKYLSELDGKIDFKLLMEKRDLFENSVTVVLKIP